MTVVNQREPPSQGAETALRSEKKKSKNKTVSVLKDALHERLRYSDGRAESVVIMLSYSIFGYLSQNIS